MALLDSKHIHALASWAIFAAILFVVAFPILSIFGSSFSSQQRLSDKQNTIDALEQRVRTSQVLSTDELIAANAIEDEKGAASRIVQTSCDALAESHAKHGNVITSPCQLTQIPLDTQFTVYISEVGASGPIESLLAALDGSQPGREQLSELHLSDGEGSGAGVLRIKFAVIGEQPEAAAK